MCMIMIYCRFLKTYKSCSLSRSQSWYILPIMWSWWISFALRDHLQKISIWRTRYFIILLKYLSKSDILRIINWRRCCFHIIHRTAVWLNVAWRVHKNTSLSNIPVSILFCVLFSCQEILWKFLHYIS